MSYSSQASTLSPGHQLPGSSGPAVMPSIQKLGRGRPAGSFQGCYCSLSRTHLWCGGCWGAVTSPPCRGGGVWDCRGCSCCQQGSFITAVARRGFSHSQIHKAMSNHVRAPMDPKLHSSLIIGSSGVAGFDWESSTSFSDSESGIYTKVRSGSTDNTKRLVTKNPSSATVLGKFLLSLVGGQETCMLFHINVIFPMDAIPV